MKYNVWYRISPSFRMDLKLTAENLDRTHRLVIRSHWKRTVRMRSSPPCRVSGGARMAKPGS